jgi:hypothetical protein
MLKNAKINLNIVNNLTCKHVKFYYGVLCIVDYIIIAKSDKICRFENKHTRI